MIRFIAYIITYSFGIALSFAQVNSEEISLKNEGIELPGTLTFTKEKSTLIIWVHGSGNVDRNGNQAPMVNANYIKQFRDSINKKNIAFYSFDKRTATKSNFPLLKDIIIKDFVDDVTIAINHFRKDNRFTEIILAGHSQGSLIAMLASKNADKIISIAGASTSIDKTILKQIHNSAPFLDSITKAHVKELKETGEIKNVNAMLQSLFAKQNQSFLKSWMDYQPTEEIKKVNKPLLIINGTEDIQVDVDNAKALKEANIKAQLILIDKMNHVLKIVNSLTENQTSYLKADFPLSQVFINSVEDFVKK